MYRRRLFVGTKNKTLGTSTTRRYRVLTYRVSVSSSGLAVAKHRRPPPEGERQFLFLFFSFLFFFAFGFVLFRFSAVVAERLNLHPRRPIGRPRANGNYGRRFHPVVLSLLLRSSFFSLKNFTSMAVGRNLRSGFFLCLPSFLPSSSAENSVTSSRKSLIQPEAKVVFFVVGCRFLRFRVGAHTKKKRPAKVS